MKNEPLEVYLDDIISDENDHEDTRVSSRRASRKSGPGLATCNLAFQIWNIHYSHFSQLQQYNSLLI